MSIQHSYQTVKHAHNEQRQFPLINPIFSIPILINSFFQNLAKSGKLLLQMSLEQTPKKSKVGRCQQGCLRGQDQPLCPQCQDHSPASKEEMPPLSPVLTPRSKVTPIQSSSDSFGEILIPLAKKEQADRKRCFQCCKKTGLLGIQCKCSYLFCAAHRLPQNHSCDFDHKGVARQKLMAMLPKVTKDKIERI